MDDIKEFLKKRKEEIDKYLLLLLERCREESPLYASMHYSLLGDGKRLRPIMLLSVTEANKVETFKALPFAAAIEMIHTYSLIHDDLPIMDNSEYRRGRPTCHKIYGSDIALLAGDALLSFAFEIISSKKNLEYFREREILRCVHEFAEFSGIKGLVGGQVMDIMTFDAPDVDENTIIYIEKRKTGALFMLAVRSGAILSDVPEEELTALSKFAENFGISYQIQDDILDAVSTKEELGKDTGQDKKNRKATFVSLHGIDKARKLAIDYIEKAVDFIRPYGSKYNILEKIAYYTIERTK
jgi:geranylgeranyl diphosphate synthase type II